MLFDSLKQDDSFPFDYHCELKRRFTSRKKPSESAAVKFAYDIHALITVMEGAEFSGINDLISVPKKRGRSQNIPSVGTQTNSCQCKAEVSLLKDTVASLQADILLMKQRHVASENIHVNDSKSLQTELSEVKQSLSVLDNKITNVIKDNTALKIVKVAQSSQAETIVKLQESMINVSFEIAHIKSLIEKHQTGGENPVNDIPSAADSGASNVPHAEFTAERLVSVSDEMSMGAPWSVQKEQSLGAPQHTDILEPGTSTYAETVRNTACQVKNSTQVPKNTAVNRLIPTRVTGTSGTNSRSRKEKKTITFADINNRLHPDIDAQNNVRETPSSNSTENDLDDFEQYVRKRTKSFYVGGFLPSITEEKLIKYVTSQGPKITKVSIFPNRAQNGTVIRINVEHDDNAHLLVDDPTFWPRGVICRPWLPKSRRNNGRSSKRDLDQRRDFDLSGDVHVRSNGASHQQSFYNRTMYGNGDYNRYSVLDTEVD